MPCARCGHELGADARFCSSCGASVAGGTAAPAGAADQRDASSSATTPQAAHRQDPLARNGANITVIVVAVVVGTFMFIGAIGLVVAIALPNLLNAIDRGKQKRTMADLRSIATSIEEFAKSNNHYPGPTDGWVPITALEGDLSPTYIRRLPANDGWGHPFLVNSSAEEYFIMSSAKDGVVEPSWGDGGPTQIFDCDIVFSNGSFVQWPEGRQVD